MQKRFKEALRLLCVILCTVIVAVAIVEII
jgi:hypothetical protein